jgi:hypothetical protein
MVKWFPWLLLLVAASTSQTQETFCLPLGDMVAKLALKRSADTKVSPVAVPSAEAVAAHMEAASVDGAGRSNANRTLKALKQQDGSIDETDNDNIRLVMSLQELGLKRITIGAFKHHKSKVCTFETVERELFLIKKSLNPSLMVRFTEQGLQDFVVASSSIQTRLQASDYWFVDQAVPGGQSAVGIGAFRHKVGMTFSKVWSDDKQDPEPAAVVDQFQGEVPENLNSAQTPRAAASAPQTPKTPVTQATHEEPIETPPPPEKKLQRYVSDSDMTDEAFTIHLLTKTQEAFGKGDLYDPALLKTATAHKLFKVYGKWLIKACVDASDQGIGKVEKVPQHMVDYYRFFLKSLLEHDALEFSEHFVTIIEQTMGGCPPSFVPASALAFKATSEHPLDSDEDLVLPMLSEKQLLFFMDTKFFKGFLKKKLQAQIQIARTNSRI